MTITFDDLSLALDFVSGGAVMEHRAFVSLETGKIYWVSELDPLDEEGMPDDLETSGRYLEIPHKTELDLGRQLALRFVKQCLPAQYNRVSDIFHRRGAYQRFKELLSTEGCLEQWYEFERQATVHALKDWCRENDIHLSDCEEEPPA